MRGGQAAGINLSSSFFVPLLIIVFLTAIATISYLYINHKRPLILRKYVSITLLIFGSFSGLTGILALFYSVVPEDLFIGLARANLVWLHTFSSIILVGVALVHVYLNFNALKIFLGFYPKRGIKNH